MPRLACSSTPSAGATGANSTKRAEAAEAEQPQKFAKLSDVYNREGLRRAQAMWSTLGKCASEDDAVTVLSKLFSLAEQAWPGIGENLSQKLKAPLAGSASQEHCPKCKQLVTGLNNLPPLQGIKLTADNMQTRRHVDNLVREVFVTQGEAKNLGYKIGRDRWKNAAQPAESIEVGGRPSVVNQEAAIAAVKSALEDNSQASSSLCKKGAEWVVANTLTERPSAIYQSAPGVYASMSESSFRRVLRRHLTEYRKPRLLTDYCQHCYDLDRKVMVDTRKAIQQWQQTLRNIMANYFEAWDAHCAATGLNLEAQPGLYLQDFEHFIRRHCESKPCTEHRNTSFPCGLFHLRKRGSTFPQKDRFDLHQQEALAGHELRALFKLLLGYLHHREAKEVQHKAISALLAEPPLGTVVLLSDWKELETLPQCWQATGDQFFAQARHEISIWGAEIVEHAESSTAEKPQVIRTQLVILSKILDHTALRTNQLVRIALEKRQSSRTMERLCVISDCGPHYRSLESCAHHLVTLHQSHECSVEIHWGCELGSSKHASFFLVTPSKPLFSPGP